MATREEIAQILAAAEQILPRKEKMDAVGASLYYALLEDIPFKDLQNALRKHALTNKWFPSVAELRELAVPDTSSNALAAWGELRRALNQPKERYVYCEDYIALSDDARKMTNSDSSHDYWDAIAALNDHLAKCLNCKKELTTMMIDPIALQVGKGMGLEYLRYSENEMVDRAHFIKAYDQLAQREKMERLMLPDNGDSRKLLD